MTVSAVTIANRALGEVSRPGIRSFDERTAEATAVSQNYEAARTEVLAAADWYYVRTVKPLIEAAVTFPGWTHAWAYPGDALRIWAVTDTPTFVLDPSKPPQPFEIQKQSDGNAVFILTRFTPAYVRYASGTLPLELLPPDIQQLIVLKLAEHLAMPLRRDGKLRESIAERYLRALNAAKVVAANAEPELVETEFVPELIRVRRG